MTGRRDFPGTTIWFNVQHGCSSGGCVGAHWATAGYADHADFRGSKHHYLTSDAALTAKISQPLLLLADAGAG